MKSAMEHPEEMEESLFEAPPMGEQERMVEAVLFASVEPVTVKDLEARMPHGCDPAEALVHLRKRYDGRGVQVMKVGDAWAIRTAADLGFLMQKETVEQRKLSRAAIETLAIIAYGQPVTRAEIEAVRGVAVSKGTIDTLMEAGWVKIKGRRRTPGRPVTLGTTDKFLEHFGLESLDVLPGRAELEAEGLLSDVIPDGFFADGTSMHNEADETVSEADPEENTDFVTDFMGSDEEVH